MTSDGTDLVRQKLGSRLAEKASPDLVTVLAAILTTDAPVRRELLFDGRLGEGLVGPPSSTHHQVSSVLHIDHTRSNFGPLAQFGDLESSRRERYQRMMARSIDFEKRCLDVSGVLSSHSSSEIVLGWSNGAVYGVVTLEGLADVAAADEVVGVGLGGLVRPRRGPEARQVGEGEEFDLRDRDGRDGSGVVVAVVDGQPGPHPWLPNLDPLQDFTGEGVASPDPHATMVAGLIGASGAGYFGVAPGVTLQGYKIFADDPALSLPESRTVGAVQAAALAAQIINCSFDVPPGTPEEANLEATIANLIEDGAVIVRSAGNEGNPQYSSPWQADGLIVVVACDRRGTRLAPYNDGGGVSLPGLLVAPGGLIGDEIIGIAVPAPDRRPDIGTSFAAALVCGLAALELEQTPGLTAVEVHQRLAGRASGPVGAVITI